MLRIVLLIFSLAVILRPYAPAWRQGTGNSYLTWSFRVFVLQTTAKKFTKINNARAQPLFCSLTFLFGDVLVAVVVLVCLRWLKTVSST